MGARGLGGNRTTRPAAFRAATAFLAAFTVGNAFAADCPRPEGGATVIVEGAHRLAFAAAPPDIRAGAPFDLRISICGPEGPFAGGLAVDADMPAHGHGMNYRPRVRMTAPGHFVAEGLMFHMRGAWRFRFSLATPLGTVRLSQERSVD